MAAVRMGRNVRKATFSVRGFGLRLRSPLSGISKQMWLVPKAHEEAGAVSLYALVTGTVALMALLCCAAAVRADRRWLSVLLDGFALPDAARMERDWWMAAAWRMGWHSDAGTMAVILLRSWRRRVEMVELGTVSEQWLAEQRANDGYYSAQ